MIIPTAVALPLGVVHSGGYVAGVDRRENSESGCAFDAAALACFFRSTHILELLSTSTGPTRSGMVGCSDAS